MLAGRNDAASLDHYVRDFGSRFAERDGTIHGAYGRRWRGGLGYDQLDLAVERLRRDPTSRQAVIQMWDVGPKVAPVDEPEVIRMDHAEWRDKPCNTHVYLRVRDGVLDLTVCCRSNDAIWGAYGANAVHFSFLQEYLAGRIGVGVGRMYQVSNNFHAYVSTLQKNNLANVVALFEEGDPYELGEVLATPVGTRWDVWDEDLRLFMQWHDRLWSVGLVPGGRYANDWFERVAEQICIANWFRRQDCVGLAVDCVETIPVSDWRVACCEFLQRKRDAK